MREILFRGKDEDGDWLESMSLAPHITENGIITSYYIGTGYNTVAAETVGQYTGLTDKNGKRIFEGDIVKDSFLLGKVVYATPQDGFDGIAGFMVDDVLDGLQNYNGFWHQVEIIGNIHDNPELLKGE